MPKELYNIPWTEVIDLFNRLSPITEAKFNAQVESPEFWTLRSRANLYVMRGNTLKEVHVVHGVELAHLLISRPAGPEHLKL